MNNDIQPSPYEEFDDLPALLDRAIEKMKHEIQPLVAQDRHSNYQLSYLISRLNQMKVVTERLIAQNQRLIQLAWMREKYQPVMRPRTTFSKRLQAIFRESNELEIKMVIDFETLYIYGNLALDHWASVVGFIANVPNSDKWPFPFAGLYKEIIKSPPPEGLRTLKSTDGGDVHWLFYNLREFRNKFIEHVDRPLQKGSSRRLYYMGFNFFVPAASGALTEQEVVELHAQVAHLQGPFVEKLPPDHWQRKPRAVLQAMVQHIETIESHTDRQLVLSVWKKIGGESPSYQTLVRRFAKLIVDSSATLADQPRVIVE